MVLLDAFIKILDNLYRFPLVIFPILGGLFSVGLLVLIVFLIRRTEVFGLAVKEWQSVAKKTPIPKGKLVAKWASIKKDLESPDEARWRLAIINADSILDEVIKSIGYPGETMGERLKNIKPYQFPNLDDAWRAHKVRNFLAHDPTYKLSRLVAERTFEIYQNIFKEFEII